MTKYEEELQKATDAGITVHENFDLGNDGCSPEDSIYGIYYNSHIALAKELQTEREKSCILAEEIGHHFTSSGDILDLNDTGSRQQELRARMWGYDHKIGLHGLISAFEAGCQTRHEIADHLEVTEAYLAEAVNAYGEKYGTGVDFRNYRICFYPILVIIKKCDEDPDSPTGHITAASQITFSLSSGPPAKWWRIRNLKIWNSPARSWRI